MPERFPLLGYATPALGLGSCFVEEIGAFLRQSKLPVCINPLGILYNPLALSRVLEYATGAALLSPDDLIESQGVWQHFDFHGQLGHADREAAVRQMQEAVGRLQAAFQKMDCLLLTLGTAFVYEHRERGRAVANCHKVSGSAFRKYRLGPGPICQYLRAALEQARQTRPGLQVILTVSPVRHIRDGVVENQQSKAALLLAAEELCRADYVHYFPAYELMMDELRDYRFYKSDYVHPSAEATAYIWSRFRGLAFEERAVGLMAEVEMVVKASRHRPRFPNTPAHRAFVQQQLRRISDLEAQHPGLDFSEERARLSLNGNKL